MSQEFACALIFAKVQCPLVKKVKKSAKPAVLPEAMTDPVGAEEVFYARVSTNDQSVDMQTAMAEKRGIPPGNIFIDHASGRSMKREGLKHALMLMRPGWTLVVYKLDRLGRNLRGLLELLEEFDREGWNLVSITEQIDTRGPFGKFYLAMLGALAQLESDMTAERTRAGMARVKERGIRLGRIPKLERPQLLAMEKLIRTRKDMTLDQIAKHFGIKRSNLLYFFPGWRGKSAEDRRAHMVKRGLLRKS